MTSPDPCLLIAKEKGLETKLNSRAAFLDLNEVELGRVTTELGTWKFSVTTHRTKSMTRLSGGPYLIDLLSRIIDLNVQACI
jgi:hypothetical protein